MSKVLIGTKTKKIGKIIAIILVTLLLVGFLGFSGFIGIMSADGITYSNEGKDTKLNSRKQLEIWNYDAAAFESAYKSEIIEVVASDMNIVPIAFYSSQGGRDNKTVIIVHGYGGDYVSTYPQIELYLELGWNVLAIDQRASGNSSSNKVSFGYYEKLDIMAAAEYVREYTDKTLAVHGISMGGATTGLYSATEHAKAHIDYIILDSSYDNMRNMYAMIVEQMEVGLPIDYFLFCTDVALRIKYGYGFKDADVAEKVKECTIPTMVIQGSKDDVATVDMGQKIYNHIAADNKEYWLNDTKHIESVIDYPVQYKERLENFLK